MVDVIRDDRIEDRQWEMMERALDVVTAERDAARKEFADLQKTLHLVYTREKTMVDHERQRWLDCALVDATMEGPKLKGWNRSALDRMWKGSTDGDL